MSATPLCGLPRAAALAQLAASIYYASVTVWDRPTGVHFEALSFDERHRYVLKAEQAIADDASLFDLAVLLCRGEGARILAFHAGQDDSQGRD